MQPPSPEQEGCGIWPGLAMISSAALEERLRIEAEMVISMFMRRDSHTLGAAAFKAGATAYWPNHGL